MYFRCNMILMFPLLSYYSLEIDTNECNLDSNWIQSPIQNTIISDLNLIVSQIYYFILISNVLWP